ncbi:30S ribosomal protein S13 [Candidatus Woesearchaeota archaeon]|nr:30S ribosomal protein S13 [Candidatus Woesearchaeota archaeon]
MPETKPESKQPELKYLVRVADTDLNGKLTTMYALSRIKGVGVMFANAVCRTTGVNGAARIGMLSDADVKKLDDAVRNPQSAGFPRWLLNRRFEPETGEDKHVIGTDLQFATENDVKFMKKTRTYKGVRHMAGQPVRGQRTRSNFRANKGKVMGVKVSTGAKKGGKT